MLEVGISQRHSQISLVRGILPLSKKPTASAALMKKLVAHYSGDSAAI
jgi:hypothetical protein